MERREGVDHSDLALASVCGLSVRFGATTALDGVDLDVRVGEVHAVVGENGAGKSTLVRAVAGVVQPRRGAIRLRDAARLAWVPQEAEMPPDLCVGEWIFLGTELRNRFGLLRQREMREQAVAALRAVRAGVSPEARLGELAATQRKQVQLARALRGPLDLLLLDEPTAVLGAAETEQLFACVRGLVRRDSGVLYVSHRLDEVMAIAGRVTVLRDGRRVSTDPVQALDTGTLVRRMGGRDIATGPRRQHPHREIAMRLVDVSVRPVEGLSLTVSRGEVVGLAGLVGAGRSEVLEAIARQRPLDGGRIVCDVEPVLVPEDRARKGLVSALGLRENLFLPVESWCIRRRRERRTTARWIERLAIRSNGTEATIDSLSGGNQQKLLLARALRRRPRLLLLDEPTAGVDVGAKAEIHETIRALAGAGATIVLASSDLPELLTLCDRIVALYQGRVAGVLPAAEASEALLAALITGAAGDEARG